MIEEVIIKYRNKDGNLTERKIEPKKVDITDYGYYLHAFCYLRNTDRTFKLDNIEEIKINDVLEDKEKYFDKLYKEQTGFTRKEERDYFFNRLKEIEKEIIDIAHEKPKEERRNKILRNKILREKR
jgi:predicted DNA-binding transcriptional regulator YafY